MNFNIKVKIKREKKIYLQELIFERLTPKNAKISSKGIQNNHLMTTTRFITQHFCVLSDIVIIVPLNI